MSHTPREEIARKNPWYTDEQFACARHPTQSKVITRRQNFIITQIREYSHARGRGTIRILDAGCGDGVNLHFLSRVEGAELWGVDYNPLRVERAQLAIRHATILVADMTRSLPFSREYFDVILLSQVIEHVSDDVQLLQSLSSVLKPSGIMILGTPNEGCMIARLRNHLFEPQIARTTDHVNFYTEKRILRLIECCGFRVRSVMYENFFFPISRANAYFASREWGIRLMELLGRMFRSQVGGYYYTLTKQ
jgi:2-polyprenyl-3-methyl-5-hydroxy-6-metoxy-1,4-benzoquinol methylase